MSEHNKKILRKIRNDYIYKIVARVVWPLAPIFMEIAIKSMLNMANTFPDKSILVLAFVVPASYLVDFKETLSISLINLLCVVSSIPFFCSIIISSPTIMWVGFWLLFSYVGLFVFIDYKAYKAEKAFLG